MGSLFSKSNKKSALHEQFVTTQDQAVLDLKVQRDKMKQYIKKSEKTIEHDKDLARQLLKKGMKERALLMLKKKKYLEGIIIKTENQLDTLQRLVSDLEFASIQKEVVDRLRDGNEALKQMNQMINLDEIDQIMCETKEGAEYQEEISNMLSGAFTEQDEADIELELENLTAEALDMELIGLPKVPEGDIGERSKEGNPKEGKTKVKQSKVTVEA
uniref:Charged multivesicular body protein 6 n=1 Tax=Rhabditophanes sp. KR3021 TaxID=114890 RepID=A0AC35U9I4_9BILA